MSRTTSTRTLPVGSTPGITRARATTTALAVLVGTSLVLGACGREAGTPGAAGPVEAAPVSEGAATGTITVWAMGAEGEQLQALTDGFTAENPDVTVEVTPVPWDSAHDKISTAIAAGETPDITLVGTTWMGEFAAAGAFDPTPTDLIGPDRFFEGPWSTTEVDGTSYGAPWYTETRLLYYRTDLAEQAGFSEPPATWEELTQMTKGMQTDAGAEYGISLPPGGTGSWQTFLPFAWQNGAELETDGTLSLDGQAMVDAVDYYESFFADGISPAAALDPGAMEQGFVDGSIGSFISGPWHMSLLDEQGGEDFRDSWAVAHMPTEESGTSFVGGGNLAVLADSDNREGAWKLVEWLTRPDVQQEFYDMVSALPTNPEAWTSGELADDEDLAAFGDQLEDAKSPPAIATWEQVADVIDGGLEQVTVGGTDPATAVQQMQEQAESIGTGA